MRNISSKFAALSLALTFVTANAYAQSAPTIKNPTQRLACISGLVDKLEQESPNRRTVRTLGQNLGNYVDATGVGGSIPACRFAEYAQIKSLAVDIEKSANVDEGKPAKGFEDLLDTLNKSAVSIKTGWNGRAVPDYFSVYLDRTIEVGEHYKAGGFKLSDFNESFSNLGLNNVNVQAFDFEADQSTTGLIEGTLQFSIRPENAASSTCLTNDACIAYVENLIFAHVWSQFWAIGPRLGTKIRELEKIAAQYENYFFETGDGLYPWELLVNNAFKDANNIDQAPTFKLNLFHPSPLIYVDPDTDETTVGSMIELFGGIKMNYNKDDKLKSLPIGAALAVRDDFEQGGIVFHLPLKGMLAHVNEDAAKLMPCTICSVAVLTDFEEEWSIGLKIDVARLLYDQNKLRNAFSDN